MSVEQFEKLSNPIDRKQAIDAAPPEKEDAFKRIDLHMTLVDDFGSERRLNYAKEQYAIQSRGLDGLASIFAAHQSLGQCYLSRILLSNQQARSNQEQLMKTWHKLKFERDRYVEKFLNTHALALKIASSPQAFALNKKAEDLNVAMAKKMIMAVGSSPSLIADEEMTSFDKQVDEIFEEMGKLPVLTSAEVQNEVEQVQEKYLRADTSF